jgi:Bacteriocin-protection, YdeI or OmpD-Associated/Domain of unknown function (DUF1905)
VLHCGRDQTLGVGATNFLSEEVGVAGRPTQWGRRPRPGTEPCRTFRFMERAQSFTAMVTRDQRRRVVVPVPFEPDAVWGVKREHRVAGTVNGMDVRATIEPLGEGFSIFLGPAWRRDCGTGPGDVVDVVLSPEGPQREDLAPDVRAALEADSAAGAFFDGLAQFYRRAYLRWIDATKRRPEVRAERIAEVVDLCRRGIKERPQA